MDDGLDALRAMAAKRWAARKRPAHEESRLQRACKAWFDLAHPKLAPLLFAVPNGGRRNAREAAIMKAEGVVAGVADLLLLVPRGDRGALCVEMKTGKGRQSAAQREWQRAAEAAGNRYVVCRSLDGFRAAVEEYLGSVRFGGAAGNE